MAIRLIDRAGHRLAVDCALEGRAGTPIVFLHGITASVDFWKPTLPEWLRDEVPWVSVSLPGHFPSTLPAGFCPSDVTVELFADLHSHVLRKLLGDRKAALVGWSTGGFSALNLALRHPEQVQSVMSISGFALGCWEGTIGLLQKLLARGRIGRRTFRFVWKKLGGYSPLFRWAIARGAVNQREFRRSELTVPILAEWRNAVSQHDLDGLACFFERLAELDICHELPGIQVPTLIVGGDRDPYIPAHHTRLLAERIPGARLEMLPGTGHMFFCEATVKYQRLLCDWLEQTAGHFPRSRAALLSVAS